jgi:pyruvate-ferredoxin/flavodoxin oxidoreductase
LRKPWNKNRNGNQYHGEKKAVECGYWQLFRYNPDLRKEGKNPLIVDSKEPTGDYRQFLEGEIRYSQLENVYPERAAVLFEQSAAESEFKNRRRKQLSEQQIF